MGRSLEALQIQKEKMFNIKIPIPSTQTAFEMLAVQIHSLGWFKRNNRPYRLEYYQQLNNPIINAMIQDWDMDREEFFHKYQKQFKTKLYKKEQYAAQISQVNEAISKLQPCYDRFEKLKKSWGFEILPTYYIDINMYGIGGSYYKDNDQCGHVVIGMGRQFPIELLARTIGHEMIHLGIEDLIINPKRQKEPPVKQEEKERIVDNLCIYTMKGFLPLERIWKGGVKSNYQEVASSADYMDKIVGEQPENNLVLAVQKFLKDKE